MKSNEERYGGKICRNKGKKFITKKERLPSMKGLLKV